MLDGLAGRVFQGSVHPAELAQRLAREADLASFQHPTGPAVANKVILRLNPADLDLPPTVLADVLAGGFEAHAAEEGWRLPGPAQVEIELTDDVMPGSIRCRLEQAEGRRPPWGRLSGPVTHPLTNNRLLVGRGFDCDVVVNVPEVSRHHALLWRQHGAVWLRDLDSANGTIVNGQEVGPELFEVMPHSLVSFADRSYRLEIARPPCPM